jgi:hypothetical protein
VRLVTKPELLLLTFHLLLIARILYALHQVSLCDGLVHDRENRSNRLLYTTLAYGGFVTNHLTS